MSYQILYERELPLGHLTAVSLPETSGSESSFGLDNLEPTERTYALDLPYRRRVPWIGGRVALKNSLKRFGAPIVPLLSTPRGAPHLPSGFVGSISHKESVAVGLVTPDQGWTIGVDLEQEKIPREGIESMILTEKELSEINRHPSDVQWKEILLRFSIKEAVYKAIDPHVKRFVGFKEVSVLPRLDGSAGILWHLKKDEGPFHIEAHWMNHEGYYISTIRIKPGTPGRNAE